MKKKHIRDYATEAFRFYARVGGAGRYRQALWERALMEREKSQGLGSGIAKPCEAALVRAERAVMEADGAIADLEAVERTLEYIRAQKNGQDVLRAVEMVYLKEPEKEFGRGEMTARVRQAEMAIPASEKTVYRWLEAARTEFARERGLRL